MLLQVREQDRKRAVRVEQAAVVIAGGHQYLYGELREACYLFSFAPRGLRKVSLPVKPSYAAENHFPCCQRGKQSKWKESQSGECPQGISSPTCFHSLGSLTILTSVTNSLSYNHISLFSSLPVSVPFPFKSILHPVTRDPSEPLYFPA